MKRFLACLLLLTMILTLSACLVKKDPKTAKDKEFTCGNMSITLTDGFREARVNGYATAFESADSTIYVIKEAFADLTEEQAALDVAAYGDLFRFNNATRSPAVLSTENELVSTEYTFADEETGVTYKYFTAFFKGSDAFWAVEFACEESLFADYKACFVRWAQSVVVA